MKLRPTLEHDTLTNCVMVMVCFPLPHRMCVTYPMTVFGLSHHLYSAVGLPAWLAHYIRLFAPYCFIGASIHKFTLVVNIMVENSLNLGQNVKVQLF